MIQWLYNVITDSIVLPSPRGLKMPPEGSGNIPMLQPRRRKRMKGKGYMSAESFSFYQDMSASISLDRNGHMTTLDIKESVFLNRQTVVSEFYQ